ncbi:hypothetical protein BGE01nite_16670 [Brevifollis gellanilyticus]|uniref:Uncharacterized protein n=1 Tax=Brevifollis gellanilyticus TaxID=748831 RepID=A0A512M6L0_9BACT|nr:hypothetical protein BGE01nite_16670 [Brevifollis gellanilyticus]
MYMGAVFMAPLAALLFQLLLGFLSQWLLRKSKSRPAHLGLGLCLGVIVTTLVVRALHIPHADSSGMNLWAIVAAIFVPPIVLGHAWSYRLKTR